MSLKKLNLLLKVIFVRMVRYIFLLYCKQCNKKTLTTNEITNFSLLNKNLLTCNYNLSVRAVRYNLEPYFTRFQITHRARSLCEPALSQVEGCFFNMLLSSLLKKCIESTIPYFLILLITLEANALQKPFCIMLDPAGDAQYAGRKLDNNFERGVTLRIVHYIKDLLQERFPTLEIILTRFPGEIVTPLQNANFANRLKVDLYVSIHAYLETTTKPELTLFCFSYNNNDFASPSSDILAFYPYDQAYKKNLSQTKEWSDTMRTILNEIHYAQLFLCKGPYFLPFKPLIGITCPAIACECGIKTEQDWKTYIEPLVHAISAIIESDL